MANYKFVNADQLDADLTAVADKIRAKGGTTAQLAFPSGYEAAVEAISTGVELNYDVVAYATEAALLAATPKENTIGIITTTPITSHIFSAEEPSAAVEGMIWITVGTSSTVEFNALKKNAIQVYPMSAQQYVSGAWVAVPAKTYQKGKWIDWITYLYHAGDECTDLTGGWALSYLAFQGHSGSQYNHGSVTKNASSMSIVGYSNYSTEVHTTERIDLTDVDTIVFSGTISSIDRYDLYEHALCVWNSLETNANDIAASIFFTEAVDGEVSLDVSALSGSYYIGFGMSSEVVIEMEELWLE